MPKLLTKDICGGVNLPDFFKISEVKRVMCFIKD